MIGNGYSRAFVVSAIFLFWIEGGAVFAQGGGSFVSDESGHSEAFFFLTSLNEMRDSLAGGIAHVPQKEVTEETFSGVCKPIGMKFTQEAARRGWEARQVSSRARNPKHALSKEAQWVERFFVAFPFIDGVVRKKVSGTGRGGLILYRRITVTDGCLACHGKKELRPDFIKTEYPEDRAYGFRPGDLRGFYEVQLKGEVRSSTSKRMIASPEGSR